MRLFAGFTMALATALVPQAASAQAGPTPPMSDFFKTCLASGGAPSSVGDYPNIQVMTIINYMGINGAGTPMRFMITAAPTAAIDTSVVIQRAPTPSEEQPRFTLRQNQSAIIDATFAKVINTYGGRMELCVRRF